VPRLLVTANVVPSPPILFTLMMEAMRSSKPLVFTRATRLQIPQGGVLHSHHCGNRKSYTVPLLQIICTDCGSIQPAATFLDGAVDRCYAEKNLKEAIRMDHDLYRGSPIIKAQLRMLSSCIWCRLSLVGRTDVSEKHIASIFRVVYLWVFAARS
jgi:hypothetical protein